MRRADRLFAILQILRRGKVARAVDIAAALDVTPRTIYRDVSDLMAHGVPIDGAAGVGYVLRPGYDLPPLMFDQSQLEALVLGARIVESWGDPELAVAAALRRAVRDRRRIRFAYRHGAERPTERHVRPLALAFFGPVWLLAAWCELRGDFRVFRLDRMSSLSVLDERFRAEPGKTAHDFLAEDGRRKHARRAAP